MHSKETRPPILYFGNDWSAENRTSSHHIALRLAKQFRVWSTSSAPGWRAPGGSGRDVRKIVRKLAAFVRGHADDAEGLLRHPVPVAVPPVRRRPLAEPSPDRGDPRAG